MNDYHDPQFTLELLDDLLIHLARAASLRYPFSAADYEES